jgi:hypothetical protein
MKEKMFGLQSEMLRTTDEKNPFTAQEVLENIGNEYKELCGQGRVKVSIIPDICSVEFGRGVGYDIIEHIPPTQIAEISATKVENKCVKKVSYERR